MAIRYATDSGKLQPYPVSDAVILTCSQCQSRFLVPDQAIGAKGREVRCGKCSFSWFQLPPPGVDDDKVIAELDSMLEEINTKQKPPKVKPIPKGSNLPVVKKTPLSVVQTLSLAVVGTLALALCILVFMPGLYGLSRSDGLVLADVGVLRVVNKDKHMSFQISGKIANMTDSDSKRPTLRVTLLDNEGTSLDHWDFKDNAMIEAHKDAPFSTGDLEVRSAKATRFVAELGNPLELALRRKPEMKVTAHE